VILNGTIRATCSLVAGVRLLCHNPASSSSITCLFSLSLHLSGLPFRCPPFPPLIWEVSTRHRTHHPRDLLRSCSWWSCMAFSLEIFSARVLVCVFVCVCVCVCARVCVSCWVRLLMHYIWTELSAPFIKTSSRGEPKGLLYFNHDCNIHIHPL